MRKARYLLSLALLLAASLYLLPALQAADDPVPDSPEVTELLTQAKNHAVVLRNSTQEMSSFRLSKVSWQSHAYVLSVIKEHVNRLGEVLQQMNERDRWASPWQQTAMDRINPLAAELASNIEKTIEHVTNNEKGLYLESYPEILTSNSDVASMLWTTVSDFETYGRNKSKAGRLGTELEVPGR